MWMSCNWCNVTVMPGADAFEKDGDADNRAANGQSQRINLHQQIGPKLINLYKVL